MQTSTCHNCGEGKTLSHIREPICLDCETSVDQAVTTARQKNLDLGAARREALATRAHSVHSNRPDPRRPLSRADYWAGTNPRD